MRRVSFLASRTRKAPADGFTAAKKFAAPDEIPAMGVALRGMPFEFTDREYEPEAQVSSPRGAVPPLKITGVGVLDPLVPPRKQPGPLTPIPASRLQRIFAMVMLITAVIAAVISVAMLLMQH
jgi:hypothetical protein